MPTRDRILESVASRIALRRAGGTFDDPGGVGGTRTAYFAAGLADVLVDRCKLISLCAFVRPKGGGAVDVKRGHAWKHSPECCGTHMGGSASFLCKEIVSDLAGGVLSRCCHSDWRQCRAGWSLRVHSQRLSQRDIDQLLLPWRPITPRQRFRTRACAPNLTPRSWTLCRHELEMRYRNEPADLQRTGLFSRSAEANTHRQLAWNVRTAVSSGRKRFFAFMTMGPQKNAPTCRSSSKRVHPEDRPQIEQRAKWRPRRRGGWILRLIFRSFCRTER